ncbi:ubiquitin-like modifier-activating enzyme 6 [Plakobranchus ocellatus]|uniref:E1 ubiquitin-activating enzyme n=1 Tax=Plakobranchus ocellatus TaxID=259542 RepID=A0AAV4B588_9GAST|nr:ubiquitin-like modifier-activating enzyme 6 [Plakobranchus ocellatus]
MADTKMEIDDSLYSRQRYVLGDSAMHKMANSTVLIYGMGGVGVEIAKNIVLAGIKSVTVQDPKVSSIRDLGVQFFLRESDVKAAKNRAEATAPHLIELNPYVTVMTKTQALTCDSDLSYLKCYQCVILTDCSLNVQQYVNHFCRSVNPQIKFLSSDVYGVFGSVFTDFGDSFEIYDANGEEPKDVFICDITKDVEGEVTCLDQRAHGLVTGDTITFREVKGMTELNGAEFTVKVLNSYKFSIGDTTHFSNYEEGGIMTEVKVHQTCSYQTLESQLTDPTILTPDLSKTDVPSILHIAYLSLHKYQEKFGHFPKAWDDNDASAFLAISKELNSCMKNKLDYLNENLLLTVCRCCSGCLAPLCAVFGGIVAQEALKALTGKFTPLNQWMYLDASEVVPQDKLVDTKQFVPRGDRYDHLRVCVGDVKCQLMADTNLFMVGCGAIGCEMLKNYSLLGLSCGAGKITITDNDLIEKSNLNRQFLFRSHHIQKPKSTTAAAAALEINKDMNIEAQQHKVCPQTEKTMYSDAFFENQHIVVNALDNVEARRYMDGRCVTNQKALMESGTMGAKGHVQVIVPHLTESYTSQQDPVDEDYPYCTVKSFPATLEHCIQWARDKFEECFVQNAQLFNKFIESHPNIEEVAEQLVNGVSVDGGVKVSKILANRPSSWSECVAFARIRFEKYFNHKAKQLLHVFPADKRLEDGVLFWSSPKRPPTPVEFDPNDEMHMLFVTTTAHLYADIYKINFSAQDLEKKAAQLILSSVHVPPFTPKNKRIITDETVSKEDATNETVATDCVETAGLRMKKVLQTSPSTVSSPLNPLDFEKDDDSNGHIDFIASTTNLRAQMYSIDQGDRLKIKKIAGRIVPAIATTTAAVSGLVTIEMIKVLCKAPLEQLRNCFLNLALPFILLSEPGPVQKTVLREGLSVTVWDKWEIKGTKDFTLQDFLNQCKLKFGFEATSIVQGVKIIFMPFMPGHMKRLTMLMTKLLKPVSGQMYVDLVVSFDGDNGEDVPGPPVRYYF